MILILLGTQDKSFVRLVKAVDQAVNDGYINEEVIAQLGYTKYKSKNIKTFDLLPKDEYEAILNKADLIITHSGVGSILTGLKNNKKIIAAARLKKLGEHTNDHQTEIRDALYKEGYILKLDDFDKLPEVLKEVKKFKPRKYTTNNSKFVDLVENYIDSL